MHALVMTTVLQCALVLGVVSTEGWWWWWSLARWLAGYESECRGAGDRASSGKLENGAGVVVGEIVGRQERR